MIEEFMFLETYFIIGVMFSFVGLILIFLRAYATYHDIELIFPLNVIKFSPQYRGQKKIAIDNIVWASTLITIIGPIVWPLFVFTCISMFVFLAIKDIFYMFFAVDPDSVNQKDSIKTKKIKIKKRVIVWLSIIVWSGSLPIWAPIIPDLNGANEFSLWYGIVFMSHLLYIALIWKIADRSKREN